MASRRGIALTATEQTVMLTFSAIGHEAQCLDVVTEIERRVGQRIGLSSVYMATKRLLLRGLVSSRQGDPTPKGKPPQYFLVTDAGRTSLQMELERIDRLRGAA